MIEWHRLFGLALIDFFHGSGYQVELEKDLSIQKQLLDVVIIEKKSREPLEEVPDGLENLAAHNLLTYKSHKDTLDEWTLDELIGHWVNYRKQKSPSSNELLPKEIFRLYAVSARYPRKLLDKVPFENILDGVYDLKWGSRQVRVIVLSRISKNTRNAIWQLFSAKPENFHYGASNYKWKMEELSATINKLYHQYKMEGMNMPYTVEDFQRDYVLEHLHELSAEEILAKFPTDELLKKVSSDERLKGLKPDERLKGLKPDEVLAKFSIEDLLPSLRKQLSDLDPEEAEKAIKKLLEKK